MRDLVLNDSNRTLIKIYTPDELYIAQGSVEIIEDGAHGSEIVLEMRGSIHAEDTEKYKEENLKETDKIEQPTILRVYTAEEEIYSFCSQKKISSEILKDRNQIEF